MDKYSFYTAKWGVQIAEMILGARSSTDSDITQEVTILFHLICLGDSLTDCDHCFSRDLLGSGYVKMLSERFAKEGQEYTIRNYGTDGFTIQRLLKRVQTDDIWTVFSDPQSQNSANLIITILIGINDVSLIESTCRTAKQKEKMLKDFQLYYLELLTILTKLTDHIILAEPFLFPCPAYLKNWYPTLEQIRSAIQKLAQQFQIPFLSLHRELKEQADRYGYSAITEDGVHLTKQGQEFLASRFYDCITSYKYV